MRPSTTTTSDRALAAPQFDHIGNMPGEPREIERARPLLGTIVSLRIAGLDPERAHALADAAFAEIALIHRLMSFQDSASELSRINHEASGAAVPLDPHTRACLQRALDHAARSAGAFDPVRSVRGSWRDIVIARDGVRLCVPLTIDLSGIAKGYAVDRACTILRDGGASVGTVNAGGDLRVFGGEESVMLRPSGATEPAMLTLSDGALASSDTAQTRATFDTNDHFVGAGRSPVADAFVTVCAPACIDADALTKVVLALRDDSAAILQDAGAVAYLHDADGWRTIGGGTS